DCESFYRGDLMKKMVEFSDKTGGYLAASDFENYRAEWVEPISTDYKGYTVSEIPPNGHGITVLMALNMLKGMELSADRDSADTYHKIIETVKLAFVDTKKFVADPRFMKTKVEDMLSDRYADVRRALIGHDAVMPEAGDPACGGTVYFCTADTEGNMCSFIQSNYNRFGSGIVVPGTGITLQDRGANFSLDPESDNYLEGGKKAYHTIIPGFLSKDGKPVGPFGVMGGFMQPQGHVQVVVNTIDYHMNPQEALDAPRFQWVGGKKVQLEREVDAHVAYDLAERGHQVEILNTNLSMGRGQIIWQREDGTLVGGTEPRADGSIAVW
ncbi:MAG: gamma-glutamyltransferase family protein, partial [Phascolarctobacterium sp.]|nr:gamma-glutamyltransferase family protein [Phascolarctobacterium sp.]